MVLNGIQISEQQLLAKIGQLQIQVDLLTEFLQQAQIDLAKLTSKKKNKKQENATSKE